VGAPATNLTVTVTRASGSTNLIVASGAALTFTPANGNVFQTVNISALDDPDTNNEVATFSVAVADSIQTVTVTGLDNDAQPIEITGVALAGGDVIISFTTSANDTYRVERGDSLVSTSWSTVGGTVPGTGNIVQVTDVGGAGRPSRYYRVAKVSNNPP
jgi:hypothetical protein